MLKGWGNDLDRERMLLGINFLTVADSSSQEVTFVRKGSMCTRVATSCRLPYFSELGDRFLLEVPPTFVSVCLEWQ
eukprot:jgi/Botrbrau1/16228/Bobra.0066s0014.1